MIICHSRQFVLLALWKTASQTCHASLEQWNESTYSRFFHYNPSLGRVVHQHATLADLMAMPEGKLGYRLAAFVRNPYDRAYSGFRQIQRDFEMQPRIDTQCDWVNALVRTQIAENMARVISAGFDFDAWIAALPEYEIYDAGPNTNMPLHPAHYWTHLGDICADYIGKVEQFDHDFATFCTTMGIPVPPVQVMNASADPVTNTNSFSRYANRMSRRSLDRINGLFARDFELFGYDRL